MIRQKKIDAIKGTCIFKALETYHHSKRTQQSQNRYSDDAEYFEMDSNSSSDKNEHLNNSDCKLFFGLLKLIFFIAKAPISKMIEFIDQYVDESKDYKLYHKENKLSFHDTKCSEGSIEETSEPKCHNSTNVRKRKLIKKKSHSNVI